MHEENQGENALAVRMDKVRIFCLPAAKLLKKPGQFQRVYAAGFRFSGQDLSIIILKNDLAISRLGISIHRKLRGAVRRNRIRRLAREYFRLHPFLPAELRAAKERIRGGRKDAEQLTYDIVITVRPAFAATDYASFSAVIDAVLAGRGSAPGSDGKPRMPQC